MSETFLVGDVARLPLRITDLDGAAVDPAALTLKQKPPAGLLITHSYGAAAEIVKDGVGRYHADIPLTASGQWAYRWELAAPAAGAAEGIINVQKSRVI